MHLIPRPALKTSKYHTVGADEPTPRSFEVTRSLGPLPEFEPTVQCEVQFSPEWRKVSSAIVDRRNVDAHNPLYFDRAIIAMDFRDLAVAFEGQWVVTVSERREVVGSSVDSLFAQL